MSSTRTKKTGGIIFVTGTGTGVGKTLLTCLLLAHLRAAGTKALAMKPFCSGGLGDVRFFDRLQNHELPKELLNPFYFAEPVSPLVAARKHRRQVGLNEVLNKIQASKSGCEVLLVEGSGGVLVPLGEGYLVADLIEKLACPVIVVARNKLGVINHTLLTVRTLQGHGVKWIKVVLMGCEPGDYSTRTNHKTLQEWLSPVGVVSVPFLGRNPVRPEGVKERIKSLKKTLAWLADFDSFCGSFM